MTNLGIAEIADRLISHMDSSRRLYMLLIAASLALAVASFAFLGLMLAPGGVPAVGLEYEFLDEGGEAGYLGRGVLGIYEGTFEGRLLGGADGPTGPFYGEFVGEFGGQPSIMSGEFHGSFDGSFDDFYAGMVPGDEFGMYEGMFEGEFLGEFYGMANPQEFEKSIRPASLRDLAGTEYDVVYVPETGAVPTFIASSGEGPPTDVTSAVAGFVGIMSAISLLVLYVGLRESMFYSDWAPRFKKYKKQREDIDRELDSDRDGTGEQEPTPSS